MGQVARYTLGNGITSDRYHDAATLLLTGIYSLSGQNICQNLGYVYDYFGNLAVRYDKKRNLMESFRYDALDRLEGVVLNDTLTGHASYDALDYFGFEGEYKPKKSGGGKYVDGNDYFGSTNPTTGKISFGNLVFDHYDDLRETYEKELFHKNRFLHGEISIFDLDGLKDMRLYPEEAFGFLNARYNNGLYPLSSINCFGQANAYWLQVYGESLRRSHFYDFIFKIPRRW